MCLGVWLLSEAIATAFAFIAGMHAMYVPVCMADFRRCEFLSHT